MLTLQEKVGCGWVVVQPVVRHAQNMQKIREKRGFSRYDNNGVLTKHVHLVYDVYDNLIEEDIDPNGGGTYTTIEQFTLDVVAKPPSAGNAPLETFDASGNLAPSAPADTLLEFVNGALAYRFLNGPSPSSGDAIYAEGKVESLLEPDLADWVFVNNQGSPTETVDSMGNLIDHEVWSPFGQLAYESNPSVYHVQGFSGGILDANTGLTKDGERWYDPAAAVWISVDPAGFAAGDADLSRYVGNGPTDAIDSSGLGGFDWWYGNGFLNQRGKKLDEQLQQLAIKRALANDTLVDNVNKIRTMGYSDACTEARDLAAASITFTACGPTGMAKPLNWGWKPWAAGAGTGIIAGGGYVIAKKVAKPGTSGKAGATNKPSWVTDRPNVGACGEDFAKRLLDEKYGEGNWTKGPGEEFNQIKKWADRHFMDPPAS